LGDEMRIYYVFKIKEEYIELYKDTPSTLYNILNQMYYMKRKELGYGFNLFNQIINLIDKNELDKNLYVLLHTKMKYSKKGDEHIINNLYQDEISVLKINKTHILINSNHSYTEFFELLHQYDNSFFVCDFNNNDYFFLTKANLLV
jgi:hypothetical protein